MALLMGLLFGYPIFSNPMKVHELNQQVSALEAEKTKLAGELRTLKEQPPKKIEVIEGATIAQCTTIVTEAVAKACRPPAPKLVYAKPQRSYAVATARTSSATAHAAVYTEPARAAVMQKPMDICIFRIKGEEKARTTVENGAVNCPLWEQQQVAAFRQKPEDKIWSKVYPTSPAR